MSTKKGRLSKQEINEIKKLSFAGNSIIEIGEKLNRKVESIEKHMIKSPNLKNDFKMVKKEKNKEYEQIDNLEFNNEKTQSKNTGPVKARKNSFKDDKTIGRDYILKDKKLYNDVKPVERNRRPNNIRSTCKICGKVESINRIFVIDGEHSCERCLSSRIHG